MCRARACAGLYRIGRRTPEAADFALEVLTSHGEHSWLHMIEQGATATMEGTQPQPRPRPRPRPRQHLVISC